MALPWWQHHKHCRAYYHYYLPFPHLWLTNCVSGLKCTLYSCCARCRLYLVNSPVVRADNLRFKEEGVRDVVKDVFLPWYNAYRFLMQNVERLQRVGVYMCLENDSDENCCSHSLQLMSVSSVVTKWYWIMRHPLFFNILKHTALKIVGGKALSLLL